MKEINLPSGNYLFVEVSDDAYEFTIESKMIWYKTLPNPELNDDSRVNNWLFEVEEVNNLEIISTTKDITEEQRISIIEEHPYSSEYWEFAMMPLFIIYGKKQYKSKYKRFDNGTENDEISFKSLIQANGLDVNKNYLILHKL